MALAQSDISKRLLLCYNHTLKNYNISTINSFRTAKISISIHFKSLNVITLVQIKSDGINRDHIKQTSLYYKFSNLAILRIQMKQPGVHDPSNKF